MYSNTQETIFGGGDWTPKKKKMKPAKWKILRQRWKKNLLKPVREDRLHSLAVQAGRVSQAPTEEHSALKEDKSYTATYAGMIFLFSLHFSFLPENPNRINNNQHLQREVWALRLSTERGGKQNFGRSYIQPPRF